MCVFKIYTNINLTAMPKKSIILVFLLFNDCRIVLRFRISKPSRRGKPKFRTFAENYKKQKSQSIMMASVVFLFLMMFSKIKQFRVSNKVGRRFSLYFGVFNRTNYFRTQFKILNNVCQLSQNRFLYTTISEL